MTLEEAIKNAEKLAEKHTNYNRYGGFESYDEIAKEQRQLVEWLKELKQLREQTRWIPVSERLPEEETDVLVCNSNGEIEISSGAYSTEVNDFMWYTSGWKFGKVIAWMPLPEPYKVESEVAK